MKREIINPFRRAAWNLLAILAFLALGLSSCNRDCKDSNCQNGGVCEKGECLCPDGFTGPNCETSVEDLINDAITDTIAHIDGNGLGYFETDHNTVPNHVTPFLGSAPPALPASVDHSDCMPPVQNQGQFGTCVAWATAYYGLTGMYCLDHRIPGGDLTSNQNQFSPKDLFLSIPEHDRGANCKGTNLSVVGDRLIARGCATMVWVPYTGLGDCSQGTSMDGDNVAKFHKISNYRSIAWNKDEVKRALANDHLVIFGAKLQASFGSNRGAVINGQTGVEKGGHAMLLVGYDDSKSAFKFINSWGTGWGDQGYGWVDYDYFFGGNFCYTGNTFIINNDEVHWYPPNGHNSTGPNLTPWVFTDHSTFAGTGSTRARTMSYNILNYGDASAMASQDYKATYLYVNAHDLSDGGILFSDNFNTSIPANTFNCNGADCTYNMDIPANSGLAQQANNTDRINVNYEMPNITGDYYIVLYSDPDIQLANETNRSNDLFYVSSHHPIHFDGGYAAKNSTPFAWDNPLSLSESRKETHAQNTAVGPQNLNGYSTAEIQIAIQNAHENGLWEQWESAYEARIKMQKD